MIAPQRKPTSFYMHMSRVRGKKKNGNKRRPQNIKRPILSARNPDRSSFFSNAASLSAARDSSTNNGNAWDKLINGESKGFRISGRVREKRFKSERDDQRQDRASTLLVNQAFEAHSLRQNRQLQLLNVLSDSLELRTQSLRSIGGDEPPIFP